MMACDDKLFTWEFSARQITKAPPYNTINTTLIDDALQLTIASTSSQNARSQTISPPEQLKKYENLFYISSRTGNKYDSIQDMITNEGPSINNTDCFVFTGKKI